jgi:uncharacterized protein YjbI with pentapeptide repeats
MTFRSVILAGLFLTVLLPLAPRAYACSCAPVTDANADAFVARTAAIFDGAMVEQAVEKPSGANGLGGAEIAAIFKVYTAYKGELGREVAVRYTTSDGVNCGTGFRIGKKETVILWGDPFRGYGTGLCGYVAVLNSRDEVLDAAFRYRARLANFHRIFVDEGPADKMKEAQFLADNSEPARALALVDDILEDPSLRRRASLFAADLNVGLGQNEAALTRLDSYLADFPDDRDIQQSRYRQLARLGRVDELPSDWRDFSDLSAERLVLRDRALPGVNFRNAEAKHADLANSRFDGADFSRARLFDTDLSGAVLDGVKMRHAWLVGRAPGVSLANADLGAARIELDLSSANLENTKAQYASFRGSLVNVKAAGLIAFRARFTGDLSGGDFRGADFRQADLRDALLAGADLTGALYDAKTVWPDGFDPAKAGAVKK